MQILYSNVASAQLAPTATCPNNGNFHYKVSFKVTILFPQNTDF